MRRVAGLSSVVRGSAVVVVAALTLSGCGGSSKAGDAAEGARDDQASASSTTTPKDGADGSSKSAEGKAGSAGKGGKGSTATTAAGGAKGADGAKGSKGQQATPTTEDPFRMRLALTAEVAEKCVRPGGVQTITIRAPYGSGVGYQVVYADGLQALMEGHYGGNGAGYVDEEGTYVDTFTVSAAAPHGPASANVLGTHIEQGFGEVHAHFGIADVLGTCRPEDMD